MSWLLAYAVAGAAVLAVFLLKPGPRQEGEAAVPLPALALVAVFWPVVVIVWLSERLGEWRAARQEERSRFRVEPRHLVERLRREEIEARERVIDPLGAVPALPFGHLNAAWRAFLASCPEGGELWSFSASWRNPLGRLEMREGYAVARKGVPLAHFLAARRVVTEERESDGRAGAAK
ncbi:MAG TPA: hypothetical protein PKC23_04235 [Candidatus Desulfobacillus sp.]|nr:hypothetical protein [Candidatus Desulfobacillus sp.]